MLTGAQGQLGKELARVLRPAVRLAAFDRRTLDLARPDEIRKAIRDTRPDVVVNAAAYTDVDGAERERALARQVNAIAPAVMAEEAVRLGALLVHYSTDHVFEGRDGAPYAEGDAPHPVNVYGQTKLDGEAAVAAAGGAYLILRTSWLYAASGRNFVTTVLNLAHARPVLRVVDDQVGSPTWARELARATARLLTDTAKTRAHPGVYHVAAPNPASRYEFAHAIVDLAQRMSTDRRGWATVEPISSADFPKPAQRPTRAPLSTEKIHHVFGIALPAWRAQLAAFLKELPGG
jgi:dTDP-4-dehydrorhamnose reductase